MNIRWILHTRKKSEAKDIIEDALSVMSDQIKWHKVRSAEPYWKFEDAFIVEMQLKLRENGTRQFVRFLKEISNFWHLSVDMNLDMGMDGEIIAADNCDVFNNKRIEWVWIEFDCKTECTLFEELTECMEFIVDQRTSEAKAVFVEKKKNEDPIETVDDEQFNVKEIAIVVIILAIIALAVVLVYSFVGGAIMKLFGFEYDSLFNLFLFFLIPTVCMFPIDNIIEILPKVLCLEFSLLTEKQAMVLQVILDTVINMLAYAVTDYFMDSVKASDLSIFIVSLVFALYGMQDPVREDEEI